MSAIFAFPLCRGTLPARLLVLTARTMDITPAPNAFDCSPWCISLRSNQVAYPRCLRETCQLQITQALIPANHLEVVHWPGILLLGQDSFVVDDLHSLGSVEKQRKGSLSFAWSCDQPKLAIWVSSFPTFYEWEVYISHAYFTLYKQCRGDWKLSDPELWITTCGYHLSSLYL